MLDKQVVKDFLIEELADRNKELPEGVTLDDLTEAFCGYVSDDYYEWLRDNYKSFFGHGGDWVKAYVQRVANKPEPEPKPLPEATTAETARFLVCNITNVDPNPIDFDTLALELTPQVKAYLRECWYEASQISQCARQAERVEFPLAQATPLWYERAYHSWQQENEEGEFKPAWALMAQRPPTRCHEGLGARAGGYEATYIYSEQLVVNLAKMTFKFTACISDYWHFMDPVPFAELFADDKFATCFVKKDGSITFGVIFADEDTAVQFVNQTMIKEGHGFEYGAVTPANAQSEIAKSLRNPLEKDIVYLTYGEALWKCPDCGQVNNGYDVSDCQCKKTTEEIN